MSDARLNPSLTQFGEKRKRTRVACDSCRKRKSKCDGGTPCSKCKEKSRKCEYIIVQRERKPRTPKTTLELGRVKKSTISQNDSTIVKLNSRINKLEDLLASLVTKLNPDDRAEFLKTNFNHDKDEYEESDTSNYHEKNGLDIDLDSDQVESSESDDEISVKDPKIMKDMLAPGEKSCLTSNLKRKLMQYFGAHSICYILSAKSLNWIKSKVQGEKSDDIFTPFKQLPLAFKTAIKASTSLLAESNPKLETGKMFFKIEEQGLIFEVLEYYYEELYIAPFLCDISTIRELFQIYFYGLKSNDYGIIDDFIYGELLIMNASILLCLINWKRDQNIDPVKYSNLSKITDIIEFANRLFNNSMQCYRKISKSNEGLRAVQGLALLIIYIEITSITDFHMNYILVSDLIGMAKEMGLHSVDYLQPDNIYQNAMLKRILWWFCEYIACEVSYKSGKSMLINMEDVTTLTEHDDHFLSIPKSLFYTDKYKENANNIFSNAQKHGYHYYFAYFGLMITRIKMKSYNKLFSKLPTNINIQGIFTIINEINDDFAKMNNLMMKGTRLDDCDLIPLENPFSCKKDMYNYQLIHIRCSYYAHLSSVNRIPFIKNFNIEDERLLAYGNMSLNSSRKLLTLVNKLDKGLICLSGRTTIAFYPIIAFCSLLGNCLIYPDEKSSYNDGLLLIKTLDFFSVDDKLDYLNSKVIYYDFITKALTRVLIDKMDSLKPQSGDLLNTKNQLLNYNYFEQIIDGSKITELSSNPSPIDHENNNSSLPSNFDSFDFDFDQVLSNYTLDNTFMSNMTNNHSYNIDFSLTTNFNEIPISDDLTGFL